MLLILVIFEKYLIYSVETTNGRTDYYYYDEITWIVSILAVFWLVWFFINRTIRARGYIRKVPVQKNQKDSLKKIISAKNELSQKYLKKDVSENINGVGIGKFNGGFCLQVFINNGNEDLLNNLQNEVFPNEYKGFPIIFFEIPQSSFLGSITDINKDSDSIIKKNKKFVMSEKPLPPIRDLQEIIVGGISGANSNLNGQSGTIGYFCKKKSIIPRRSATYLLSNKHVFADLRVTEIDEHDLIVQPSPGEPTKSEPIGELTNYSKINLDNDVNDANLVDAAIAKLWNGQKSENLIPMIGKIKGFVKKEDVEIGEFARKFGRTTGFTAGNVFSIYLDIWIKYDRTGQKAFFSNQILIEPNSDFEKFVDKGDSGSLVVDADNYASGLIFAGANGNLETNNLENGIKVEKSINNYGVANPISDVLKELKIEFIAE